MSSPVEKPQYSAERIAFLLLFLAALLRPHLSGIAYPFSQGMLLVPLLVGLGLIFLSADARPGLGKWPRISLGAVWLLTGWLSVTLLWTPDPGYGVREFSAFLINSLVFTLTFLLVSSENELGKRWIGFAGLTAGIVAIRAVYQRFFGFDKLLDALGRMEASGEYVAPFRNVIADRRVFAGFLNPNVLAGFLVIVILFLLDIAVTSQVKWQRRVSATLVLVLAFVLLLTGSFGGILVAVIMSMALVLFRKRFNDPLVVAAAFIAAGLVIGVLVVRGPDFIIGLESSVSQRVGYITAGIKMAAIHPFSGWGAGSSPGALMAFVAKGVRPVTDPHNFLVRAWTSWGVIGAFLMVVALWSWAAAVSKGFKNSGWRSLSAGRAGLFCGSCGFLIHSLMDMDFFVPETAFFGWWIMGAAMGTAFIQTKCSDQTPTRNLSWGRLLPGIVLLAAVLPSLVYSQGELTAFRGDRKMNEGRYRDAADLYHAAGKLLPYNGHFALDEGRALMAVGDKAAALQLFERADGLMKASPYPSWERGLAAFEAGNADEAVYRLELALRRYPTSPRIRIDLARVYHGRGDNEKVVALLREALRYAVFDRDARRIADEALAKLRP